MIEAYPLCWPDGWRRTSRNQQRRAQFHSGNRWLSIADGVYRVLETLERMGVGRDDIVISTNVRSRLDGFPRSDQPEPEDSGVAVYWETKKGNRVMAIDQYNTVGGNLGAIAATLEAMRAIERHGGAQILERAFTGFSALPSPDQVKGWRDVLGFERLTTPTMAMVDENFRKLAAVHHPDRGGSTAKFQEIAAARDQARMELDG